jgi:uncharacterized protein (DUF1501 family)
MKFSRRRFLEIAAAAGGGLAVKSWSAPAPPRTGDQLLLLVHFSGGWDQLLALDPRPNNDPRFSSAQAYSANGSGIYPAYDRVVDPTVQALLSADRSGVQYAGNLSFGPAVPQALLQHAGDLSIVRGVTMDTLTHEVGRDYFLTGKFPRGLTPNGSSLNTVVAGRAGEAKDIPNLSVATESYNEGWPAFASAIRVNSVGDLQPVLRPLGAELAPATDGALADYEAAAETCETHAYDSEGLVSLFRASRARSRALKSSRASALFDFNLTNPGPEVQPLFDALGISAAADLRGIKGRAAVAAQALAKGLSQSVAVQLAVGLDDHSDWGVNQAPNLRASFDTLGRLIAYLKAQPYGGAGETVWQHTTLLVFSEFARTPLLNGRGGRDHHLASSCLLAGPGIRGNLVVGGTTDTAMAARKIDFHTGQPDETGQAVRPCDVHATVLASMGFSDEPLSSQSPKVIEAALR